MLSKNINRLTSVDAIRTGILIESIDGQDGSAKGRGFRQGHIVFVVTKLWGIIIRVIHADADWHFRVDARHGIGGPHHQLVPCSAFVVQLIHNVNET